MKVTIEAEVHELTGMLSTIGRAFWETASMEGKRTIAIKRARFGRKKR